MNKIFLTFPFLFLYLNLHAQKQATKWYFGVDKGIDFSSGVPVEDLDGVMKTLESCASYSDAYGNLLFYSNGGGRDTSISQQNYSGTIWNREHDIMYDMNYTEGGGWSASQSPLIIPNPNDSRSQFYLFTMEEIEFYFGGTVHSQPMGRGLSFFEIDMSLNGGLGQVTIADERVYVPTYETLAGTAHNNGCDYWIIISNVYLINPQEPNSFGVASLTKEGLSDVVLQPMDTSQYLGSEIKISPNGTWISSNSALFNFDNSTGIISESFIDLDFEDNTLSWAFSFSPNSKYIYYRNGGFGSPINEIIRFDLTVPDVAASKEVIAILDNGKNSGQMQIGPDGHIYFIHGVDFINPIHISSIRCPNSETPEIQLNIFTYDPFPIMLGLPNFTDNIFKTNQPGIIDIGPDTILLCNGITYEIGAETELENYAWNTGETSAYITIDTPGIYILNADHYCGSVCDTLVALDPNLEGIITGPTEFCPGEVVELNVSQLISCAKDGSWSNGESTSTIEVNQPGVYSFEFTNICGETSVSEFTVSELVNPFVELTIESPPPYCMDSSITLSALVPEIADLLWFDGTSDSSVNISETGIYQLSVSNTCGTATDSIEIVFEDCNDDCIVILPNSFSPNHDGINDHFGLVYDCELIIRYQLNVYSRWGEKVFASTSLFEKWTGYLNGDPLPEDVYTWTLEIFEAGNEENMHLAGEVNLLR